MSGAWHGAVGSCFWAYFSDEGFDDDDWREAFLEPAAAFFKDQDGVAITMALGAPPPSGAQRRQLADLVAAGKLDRAAAHAMVTQSPLIRGVLVVVGWFTSKPYAEKAFADLRQATDWIRATHGTDISYDAIRADIEAVVPMAVLERSGFASVAR